MVAADATLMPDSVRPKADAGKIAVRMRTSRSATGPGHDEVVIQRAIRGVHLAPVGRHARRMLYEIGDQGRTHAEGHVAIDMLAARTKIWVARASAVLVSTAKCR